MTRSSGETVDELRRYGLRVVQKRDGYRFSLDPLLLADFARPGSDDRVIDLGTGCGIMPLLMACQAAGSRIVGVEFQQEMAALAARNAELNGLAGRIEVLLADVAEVRRHFPVSSFDLVVANIISFRVHKRIDTTKNERYSLSKGSARLVSDGLTKDLDVTLYDGAVENETVTQVLDRAIADNRRYALVGISAPTSLAGTRTTPTS